MSKDKVQEGKECMERAAKFLKTSLLKWVPDYDSAADEYSKAATCFRVGKAFKESKACFLKASENYLRHGSLFHAAKSIDQAILMSKENGDLGDVFEMAMKASYYYQQQGSSGSASLLLNKVADMLQQTDPQSSVKLFKEASKVSETEDSIGQAMEYTNKAARLLVKLKRYEEAEEELNHQFELVNDDGPTSNLGRVAVELFLLQLAKDDFVAASKVLNGYGMQYCTQEEINTLDNIVNAHSERDYDQIRLMLNNPFIKHMDIEFAILAKNLAAKWVEEPKEKEPKNTDIDIEDTTNPKIDFGGELC